ncbi:succinate dehydrogenase subunit C [Thermosporothrix hazakensis]|jgi:succinate dehydrogenase / fumarate reductase cytochrome b subunit|uniref:Succinate dehydrogenase subunit C n=2 Tax=Thermosporothrix TaxID=768650 RepID=A0A326U280_THEHA|nr:succinate dehydrogenase, cytochrome b556 subunit [Thermosporothrix hazakensis]PZW24724.1 succinate dehydrogenase subunit C [Thermosporothrix hazakensis]BBH90293.1 succinate dehydrogenase, cytochrome b556 subunit [Thermosporothrix sp. COM3]GCE48330.1 succinate dehydrogenase, cytochrome b556 subunit [Thermosporothrix hazakensis]
MYKGPSGMWSWLLHRVSGLGLLLFLFIHVVDISLLSFGPNVYNEGIELFDNIIVRFLSLALIVAVFYHSFNGIRIVLVDFWRRGVKLQQPMFIAALVLTIIAFIPFAYFVLRPALPFLAQGAYWFVDVNAIMSTH